MAKISYDVLLVGGGVASLSAAHALVNAAIRENAPLRLAVLEKGRDFGAHVLSGAVSNPRSIKKLFPDYETNGFPLEGRCAESHVTLLGLKNAWDLPSFALPELNKIGYLILSLGDVCKWMASSLSQKTKDHASIVVDLFTGFGAQEIIYEGDRVVGVRVDATGVADNDVCHAKVTVFGDKGFLSKDLVKKFNLAANPQAWAVGVKEIWETERDYSGKVWHTMGFPLLAGDTGGGFVYGLKDKKLALGMVAGLDSDNPALRPPQLLQEFKKHPMVQEMIRGGRLARYGAALIPEGGYYSLPTQFAVDGALLIGDAAGVMDLKGFSGVDKAMETGMLAGDVVFEAIKKGDFSTKTLGQLRHAVMGGWIGRELTSSRYYLQAFKANKELFSKHIPRVVKGLDGSGVAAGALAAFLADPFGLVGSAVKTKIMMAGSVDFGEVSRKEDRKYSKPEYKAPRKSEPEGYAKSTVYSTADVVFYASTHYHHGNNHITEFDAAVCKRCIALYGGGGNDVPCAGDCTAEVHETRTKDGVKYHFMNLENCVQCRTCEIVCPYENLRVNPAEHGSGPDFSSM